MLILTSPPVFNPSAFKQQLQEANITADPLEDIILDFSADEPDFEAAVEALTFNDQGVCTNPTVKKIVDQAMMSQDCPVRIKDAILKNAKAYPEQFRQLLKGILDKGYAVHLSETTSDGLDVHGLDFSGGKFVANGAYFTNFNAQGANFNGGAVNDVVIFSGNLSDATVKNMKCDNAMGIQLKDVNMERTKMDKAFEGHYFAI